MIKLFFIVMFLTIQNLDKDSVISRFNHYSGYYSTEKTYLHLSRNIFIPGENLFFTGYLMNSSDHSKLPESHYIYVELLDSDCVVSRVMVKRDGRRFPGHIEIPPDIKTGEYIIRGYTNRMKDIPPEYMFYSKIHIMDGENHSDKARANDSTMIRFYPESGRYLINKLSVLAFKTNRAELSGELYNTQGELITNIKTEHDGMGVFRFTPETDTRYFIKTQKNEIFPLPNPESDGGVIHLGNSPNKINISAVFVGEQMPDSIYLMVHNNSYIYSMQPLEKVSDGEYQKQIIIQKESLPHGINHATLVTGTGKVLAERLFFIYREDARIRVDCKLDKETYSTREKITASIQLTNHKGSPVCGEFSVSVLDGNFTNYTQEDNIESYMLLSSEIKGRINNPEFYFNNHIPLNYRNRFMDLLMLVQGWRYYDTEAILCKNINCATEKEYTQSLRGKVNKIPNNKRGEYSLIAISNESRHIAEIDKDGNFVIKGLDFPNHTTFLLNVTGSSGTSVYKQIECFENPPAKLIDYDSLYNTYAAVENKGEGNDHSEDIKPLFLNMITENTLRTNLADNFRTDTLEELVINADRYYRPQANLSPYGQAFEKNQVKERVELQRNDSKPLTDYLLETYPSFTRGDHNKILSTRSGSIKQSVSLGSQSVSTQAGKSEVVLYIDGIKQETASELTPYSVRDVETLVVLRGNDGALYQSTWGVILIALRKGGREIHRNIPSTAVTYQPLGWQLPIKFFEAIYDGSQKNNLPSDYRTTIFWRPSERTNENGVAEFSFYSTDYKNPCMLRIEGVSDTGEYISGKVMIVVK